LYYLNDNEYGGETSFPVSGARGLFKEDGDVLQYHLSELSHHTGYCRHTGNGNVTSFSPATGGLAAALATDALQALLVKPKRGRALLFYNHKLPKATAVQDSGSGSVGEPRWLGEIDWFSLHGSCPVRVPPSTSISTTGMASGEKWVANHWLLFADTKKDEQLAHAARYHKKSEKGEL
jgi:hypothetical protein